MPLSISCMSYEMFLEHRMNMRQSKRIHIRTCKCGFKFVTTDGKKKTCSLKCSFERPSRAKPMLNLTCLICNCKFSSKRRKSFCSPNCRSKYFYQKKKEAEK